MGSVVPHMNATRPLGVLPLAKVDATQHHATWSPLLPRTCKYKWPHSWIKRISEAQKEEILRDRSHVAKYEFPTYHFNLTNYLRLNLTLTDIFLLNPPSIVVYQKNLPCSFNHISIQIPTRPNMRLCGILNQAIVYSESSRVRVGVHIQTRHRDTNRPAVNAHMIYSIIDTGRIEHSLCNILVCFRQKLSPFCGYPIHMRFRAKDTQLLVFSVRVEHFRFIVLKVFAKDPDVVEIFDGPGIKSKPLNTSAQRTGAVTSTFQALIYHYVRTTRNKAELNYTTTTMKDINHFVLSHDEQKFHLSRKNNCSTKWICGFSVKTGVQFVLNISLSSFSYSGDGNTESCDNAGLAVFLKTRNGLQLNNVECVKKFFGRRVNQSCDQKRTHEGTKAQTSNTWVSDSLSSREKHVVFRHDVTVYSFVYPSNSDFKKTIFSEFNSAFFVLYSFVEYGSFEVKITVSKAKCTSVFVDICTEDYQRNIKMHLTRYEDRFFFAR